MSAFLPVQKTRGLIAAPFTPLKSDRSLDLGMIDRYVEWLVARGVVGAFVCGTTGEGMSLTLDERQQVAKAWVRASPKSLRVIVHVGHAGLVDCRVLAAHAEEIGAGGIACLSPFFYKPLGVAGLVDWCEHVASAAPRTPFYFYHIPSMVGFQPLVHEFLSQAETRIPNLAGVKFTFEDLADCERCVQAAEGKYDILFGRDELLLEALRFGIRGAVGSTFNFAAPVYHALIDAHQRGDQSLAEQLQSVAKSLIDILIQSGSHPTATFKWFLGRIGFPCGPTRLPLVDPVPSQIAAIERLLEKTDILERLSGKEV